MPQSPSQEKPSSVSPVSSARLATSLFTARFSTRPSTVASAPGRVNLLGEHTDYNGGPVLPLAIERRTAAAARVADRWLVISGTDAVLHELDIEAPVQGTW